MSKPVLLPLVKKLEEFMFNVSSFTAFLAKLPKRFACANRIVYFFENSTLPGYIVY